MEELESELRRGFRAMDPPDGFTERVMVRVRSERLPRTRYWQRWGLVGAVAASLVVSVVGFQQRQDAAGAEQAEAELLYALQLAGSKLNRATDAVLPSNLDAEGRE